MRLSAVLGFVLGLVSAVAWGGEAPARARLQVMTPGGEFRTAFGHIGIEFLTAEGQPYFLNSKGASIVEYGDYGNLKADQQIQFLTDFSVMAKPTVTTLKNFEGNLNGRKLKSYDLNLTPQQIEFLYTKVMTDVGQRTQTKYRFFENNCVTSIRDHILAVVPGAQIPSPMPGLPLLASKRLGTAKLGELVQYSLDRAVDLQSDKIVKVMRNPEAIIQEKPAFLTESAHKNLIQLLDKPYKRSHLKAFAEEVVRYTGSNGLMGTALHKHAQDYLDYTNGKGSKIFNEVRKPVSAAFTPVLVIELLKVIKNPDAGNLPIIQ